jgi:hypothetical protein
MRSSVDFPDPEPPSSAKNSPRWIESVTPSTAAKPPKRLLTPSMRNSGATSGPLVRPAQASLTAQP